MKTNDGPGNRARTVERTADWRASATASPAIVSGRIVRAATASSAVVAGRVVGARRVALDVATARSAPVDTP